MLKRWWLPILILFSNREAGVHLFNQSLDLGIFRIAEDRAKCDRTAFHELLNITDHGRSQIRANAREKCLESDGVELWRELLTVGIGKTKARIGRSEEP